MKLKGISDQGFKRLAQVMEAPAAGGAKEVLLDRAADLMNENGIVVSAEQVDEILDLINHQPDSIRKLEDFLWSKRWFRGHTKEEILAILMPISEEMLDIEYEDSKQQGVK